MANDQHYKVLARKYRPGKLSELIGQDVLVRTLANAIGQDRIPHAFIMTGIRGVGKTSTARIIAKSLVCIGTDGAGTKPTTEPCGICEHCRAITEDRHVDVMEMDAASRTGVDNMREIIGNAHYHPVSARYKIYIIDEVHMLSKSAFNALLKTLEEPPPHVKFIFATTEVRKIPVTILSRCMRFDLARIEVETLVRHLASVVAQEGASAENDALVLISHAAEGSVRDGLSLLDQALGSVAAEEKITRDHVSAMLGLVGRGRLFTLFGHVVSGKPREAIEALRSLYQSGAEPVAVMQDMLELTHFITQLKLIPELAEAEHLPEGDRAEGRLLAEKLTFPFLARMWQMLLKGISEVQHSHNGLMAAEMLLVRLSYVSDLPTPGDLVKDIRKNGNSAAEIKIPAQTPRTSVELPLAPVQVKQEINLNNPYNFNELVDIFDKKGEYLLYSQLQEVSLVSFDAKQRKVEFFPAPTSPSSFAGRVGDLLSQWTGNRWVMVVSASRGTPSLHETAEAAREKRRADAVADGGVQALLAAFPGAKITAVREMEEVSGTGFSEERMLKPETSA